MMTSMKMTARVGVLAAVVALAVACSSDNPTSPSNALVATDTTLIPVKGLLRTTPLPQNITVSQTIDPNTGGTIRIQDAGLTVNVPAGFINGNRPMTITVTAYAGSMVAYEFGPSGTKFRQPLSVVQALQGTNWFNLPTTVNAAPAYFADPSQLDLVNGKAKVNELLPLNVDLGTSKLRFDITHFSGYMVSSGRDDMF